MQGDLLTSLLPLVALFAIFYFLIIRPQQKQAKAHKTDEITKYNLKDKFLYKKFKCKVRKKIFMNYMLLFAIEE